MDGTKILMAPTPAAPIIKLGKLDAYAKTVHPSLVLDEVVKRELAEYLDSFTNEVVDRACRLATNRARSCGAYRIAANDVELVLDTMGISHTPRVEALLRQRQTAGRDSDSLSSSSVTSLPPSQGRENPLFHVVKDSPDQYGEQQPLSSPQQQQHRSDPGIKWIKMKPNAVAEYLKSTPKALMGGRAVPKPRVVLASEWRKPLSSPNLPYQRPIAGITQESPKLPSGIAHEDVEMVNDFFTTPTFPSANCSASSEVHHQIAGYKEGLQNQVVLRDRVLTPYQRQHTVLMHYPHQQSTMIVKPRPFRLPYPEAKPTGNFIIKR